MSVSRNPLVLLPVFCLSLSIAACEREPCPARDGALPWPTELAPLPTGITVCESTATTVRYDFNPEPDTFADVIFVQLLEGAGWERIKQSNRKTGRKYILEKGPHTLVIKSLTEKARTEVSVELD